MTPLLQCFSSLETLCYEHGFRWLAEADFEPSRMMAGLSHLKSTLREITIVNIDKRGFSELKSYPIGSFAGFKVLTLIDADASILIGYLESKGNDDGMYGFKRSQKLIDAVPRTLQQLYIRHCDENIVPHIFELISQKTSYSPELQILHLDPSYRVDSKKGEVYLPSTDWITPLETMRLSVECAEAGVELMYDFSP